MQMWEWICSRVPPCPCPKPNKQAHSQPTRTMAMFTLEKYVENLVRMRVVDGELQTVMTWPQAYEQALQSSTGGWQLQPAAGCTGVCGSAMARVVALVTRDHETQAGVWEAVVTASGLLSHLVCAEAAAVRPKEGFEYMLIVN